MGRPRRRKREDEFDDERLYRRSRFIWARVRDEHGYIQRLSTGCTDEEAATDWANEYERKAASPSYRRAAEATLVIAIADLFDQLRRRGVSIATMQIAEQKLGHFVRIWGEDWPLLRVENELVLQYIDQREGEGVGSLTIKRELNHLRRVLAQARFRGTFPHDPDTVIPPEYSGKHTPKSRAPSPEEVVALIRQLEPRRGAHVAFLVATGARWAESCRAERADVDLENLVIRLRGTKTEKAADVIPITGLTFDFVVYAMQHAPNDAGVLFDPWGKYWRDIQAACRRAEIAPCSPNDLRRAFGTWHRLALMAKGASKQSAAEQLSVLLRHTTDKLAQTTYARVSGADLGPSLRDLFPVPNLYPETTETAPNDPIQKDESCPDTAKTTAPPARIGRATFGLGSLVPSDASERRSIGVKLALQKRSRH